jgi:outer membrane protein
VLALWIWTAEASAQTQAPARLLSLRDALHEARTRQPRVQGARADREAAEARSSSARASLLPQIVGTASYQRTTANFVARPGAVPSAISQASNDASFDTFNFYSFGATATQLLYDFGQSTRRFRAAKELSLSQEEQLRVTELTIDLEVRQAFFEAQAARDMIAVARDALSNQERHFVQIEAFVQVGRSPEIDLAQVRTDIANARVNLIRAEGTYQLAKAKLSLAMGIEGSANFEVTGEVLDSLPEEGQTLEQLLSKAWRERPELAAVAKQRKAQAHLLRATRGAYGPAINLSTTVTDAGTDLRDLTWNWNAGVQLSWALLQGGLTRAQVREQNASVASVVARETSLRQTVQLELEQARVAVLTAKAVIEAADEAVKAAEQRRTLAEGRYQAGVGNVIELEDAELALTSARAQRVRADYDLSSARALLLRALGRAE